MDLTYFVSVSRVGTVVFSFSPMAHMFDRKNVAFTLVQGGRVGIFDSDMSRIFDGTWCTHFLYMSTYSYVRRVRNV